MLGGQFRGVECGIQNRNILFWLIQGHKRYIARIKLKTKSPALYDTMTI